ncbi:MAG: hypothetical protein WC276_11155 [Sedimentibacter sp.]
MKDEKDVAYEKYRCFNTESGSCLYWNCCGGILDGCATNTVIIKRMLFLSFSWSLYSDIHGHASPVAFG